MCQIHSRHFQIRGIDEYWQEYWQIHYVKVSSRDYSSVYARMPENVDEYLVFGYSCLFSENWHMCGSTFTLLHTDITQLPIHTCTWQYYIMVLHYMSIPTFRKVEYFKVSFFFNKNLSLTLQWRNADKNSGHSIAYFKNTNCNTMDNSS